MQQRLRDLDTALYSTTSRKKDLLGADIGINMDHWWKFISKEKSIHHIMNMMDHSISVSSVVAEAWVPKSVV